MDLYLETIGRDSFVLVGGLNFSEIVGTRAQWLAVAEWLRRPDTGIVRYTQLAVTPWLSGWLIHSPRGLTLSDGIGLTRGEAVVLAEQIAVTLREQREPLTLGA